MRTGVIAQKVGMTRVFTGDGEHVPVTVLKIDNCQVLDVRTEEKHGYSALQLGWGSAKDPECRGFTPEELTRIDFARIDFTEFYADAFAGAESAERPSGSQMQQIIEQGLQRWLP